MAISTNQPASAWSISTRWFRWADGSSLTIGTYPDAGRLWMNTSAAHHRLRFTFTRTHEKLKGNCRSRGRLAGGGDKLRLGGFARSIYISIRLRIGIALDHRSR